MVCACVWVVHSWCVRGVCMRGVHAWYVRVRRLRAFVWCCVNVHLSIPSEGVVCRKRTETSRVPSNRSRSSSAETIFSETKSEKERVRQREEREKKERSCE